KLAAEITTPPSIRWDEDSPTKPPEPGQQLQKQMVPPIPFSKDLLESLDKELTAKDRKKKKMELEREKLLGAKHELIPIVRTPSQGSEVDDSEDLSLYFEILTNYDDTAERA